MRNFQLPLPDDVYRELRAQAERTSRPDTALALEAIESWLRGHRTSARHDAISAFAAEYGGTSIDLDVDMDAVSTEHLLATDTERT